MNHLYLGIAIINLVRAVDHTFAEILGRIPQFLCGMLGLKPDISSDLISLGVLGEKFDTAATKCVILFLFNSSMKPP